MQPGLDQGVDESILNDEGTQDFRKLRNENLLNFHFF